MTDDRAYLTPILDCEPDLERWRTRVEKLEVPERGSDLESDDKVFPYHRISEMSRASLAVSGENLRLALDAIYRRNLYPSAHFSTLRSALVGACQAVWILSPADGATRTERGLTVIDEAYKQSAKYHRETKAKAPNLSSTDIAALDSHLAWIATRRQQVAAGRTTRRELNLTDDVIPDATAEVYADDERRSQVRLLWKQMSCDAHVLGWSIFQRATFGPEDRVSGLALVTAGGNLKQIAQPFVATFEILKRGWSLYDRRCEGQV